MIHYEKEPMKDIPAGMGDRSLDEVCRGTVLLRTQFTVVQPIEPVLQGGQVRFDFIDDRFLYS